MFQYQKKILYVSLSFLLIAISPFITFSQSSNIPFQSTPETIKEPIANIRKGGYFRFLGYVRNFEEMYDLDIPNYYQGPYPQPTTISIGTGGTGGERGLVD